MPGISTVISVKDHFTSSLMAYRKLSTAASKSNFQLAKAAASTAYQNKALIKTALELTNQYAPLIGNQKMVAVATSANDIAFAHLYRTVDRLNGAFYKYLPILKIIGMFVPQIGLVVRQIERGELSINDVYDMVDQLKYKAEDFIQNLPNKLEKISKWAGRINGLLKFATIITSKTSLIKLGIFGIATAWAFVNRQKLKSLVIDSAMFKKAKELSYKYAQVAKESGSKVFGKSISNAKSLVVPIADKGKTFVRNKIGKYEEQSKNAVKKAFASISEQSKAKMTNAIYKLVDVWPAFEKKAKLAFLYTLESSKKAFSIMSRSMKMFWENEAVRYARIFFMDRFQMYASKAFLGLGSKIGILEGSMRKVWSLFTKYALVSFGTIKKYGIILFNLMKSEAIRLWLKNFLLSGKIALYLIKRDWNRIFDKKELKRRMSGVFSEIKRSFDFRNINIVSALKTAFQLYMTYAKIKIYISFIKMWYNAFNKVNEIMDTLLDKMDEIDRHNKRLRNFGEEGSIAFEKYARKMSESWGVAKAEIEDVGLKLRKLKLSGSTMDDIFGITNMLSKIKGEGFEEVGAAIGSAIANRSIEELAETLGGGKKIERAMRKAGIGRLLRKGKIKEAMDKYKELAESMGYTQELADKISDSLPGKIRKIKSIMSGFGSDFKKAFNENIEPYIDHFMELITSDEFKKFATAATKQLVAIAKIAGKFLTKIIEVGLAIYKWWIDPSSGILRMVIMFFALRGALVKTAAIFRTLVGAGGLLAKFLGLSRGIGGIFLFIGRSAASIIPILKNSFSIQKATAAASALFARTVKSTLLAFASNPMFLIPSMLFLGVFGAKKLTQTLTGETKPAVESVVEVFVGGITHGSLTILQGFKKIVNAFISSFARDWNNILDALQKVGNWGWKFSVKLKEKMLDAKIGFLQFIDTVQTKILSMFTTITNNPLYKKLFGEGFQKQVSTGIAAEIAALKNEKAELLSDHADTLEAMFKRNGDTESHFLDQYKWNPELLDIATQEQIAKVTAGQISKVMDSDIAKFMRDAQEMVTDLLGFGATKDAKLDEIIKLMGESNDNTGALRDYNRRELDLRWMKEMAEQRFVNDVNLRQLTPTIKVEVSGGNVGSPEDLADVLDRRLSEMAQRGTFNAYGDAG